MPTDLPESEASRPIDIVVVNWNAGHQLRQCIDSVREHGRDQVHSVIVVDNGSTDGSDRLVEQMPGVILVRAGRNLGFAAACNVGADRATAPFILLLNPDTRLFPDSLDVPLAFMRRPESARVGIVGVRNVGEGGQVQRTSARIPKPRSFIVHSFGLNAFFPGRFPDHMMREWAHDEDREVDHVIGSFFLVRRELWNQLGGMDERFFVYLEDLDFSVRAHQRGWSSWFLASASIYHKGGGTSEQIKATRLFYSLRSRLQYANKHFTRLGFGTVALATLVVEPLTRIAGALIRREWSAVHETLLGYGALYRSLPGIFRRVRVST
jgi:GT2 family glycosyltransferase